MQARYAAKYFFPRNVPVILYVLVGNSWIMLVISNEMQLLLSLIVNGLLLRRMTNEVTMDLGASDHPSSATRFVVCTAHRMP